MALLHCAHGHIDLKSCLMGRGILCGRKSRAVKPSGCWLFSLCQTPKTMLGVPQNLQMLLLQSTTCLKCDNMVILTGKQQQILSKNYLVLKWGNGGFDIWSQVSIKFLQQSPAGFVSSCTCGAHLCSAEHHQKKTTQEYFVK